MNAAAARLPYYPVAFFTMVMGLSGFAIAWAKAEAILGLGWGLHRGLAALAALCFVVHITAYGVKLVKHRDAVIREWNHPIQRNFFPAISISLLLLSVIALNVNATLASGLWVLGAALHLLFTLLVVNAWIHHPPYEIAHINPAWFIPAVGNVIVPIAGVPLGQVELSWFFFSIGMLFWVILLTIVFYRVMFHAPLPAKLLPTLFILIAPPAVGFIAYSSLIGGLDAFARVLYFIGLFLTLLMLMELPRFVKLPFALSWWAYSFPLAAIGIASQGMFVATGETVYRGIGVALLILLTAVIVVLAIGTFKAARAGKICAPEG